MIEASYFDKIEAVARHIRQCSKPFGGIQLIFCGDFLQLPPVSKGINGKRAFCFQVSQFCFFPFRQSQSMQEFHFTFLQGVRIRRGLYHEK